MTEVGNESEGKLLGEHPDWRYNARLNRDEPAPGPGGILLSLGGPNPFSTYAEGYKKLADIGVEHIAEAHWDVDLLVYPIVYCHRHYLELRFKELIRTASQLLDQNLVSPNVHDLRQLWSTVRPLLETIWPGEQTKADLDAINDLVEQFSKIDPRSYAFRYPIDTYGNRSLPGLQYINVRQVSEVIERVAPTLDGASYAIEEFLDSKGEMLAEARQEAMYYAEPPGD